MPYLFSYSHWKISSNKIQARNLNFYPKVQNKNDAFIDALQVLYTDLINAQNNNDFTKNIK